MKKVVLLFLFIYLCSVFWSEDILLNAENAVDQKIIEKKYLTHSDVLLTGGLPYLSTYIGISSRVLFPEEYADQIFTGVTLLGNIPHCYIAPKSGLYDTAISAGAFFAGFALDDYPELYGNQSFSRTFKTVGLNVSYWSYYQGYVKARNMAQPGIYNKNYETFTFKDLMKAPYNTNTLAQPSVWVPIAIYTSGLVGMYYLDNGFSDSVWNTGKAYIGQSQVPIMVGLISTLALSCITYGFTSVGEESLFRGVGYEEMKCSIGIVPAKLIDSLGFSACHIPQEMQKGLSSSTIIFDYGIRALLGLGLQWAYDDGGLKYSVAQHLWINVISSTLLYLCYAGNGENDIVLNLSFTVPL